MSALFTKILIANRGEIACRVIRTARRLGVKTVAVYSEADAGALHVAMADEAVAIGPAQAEASYLDRARIIDAAKRSRAAAIHPGYGFLSESADFAAACEAAGLVFIGPPAAAIRAMGSKAEAKALMAQAGVPLVPGYHGAEQGDRRMIAEARAIGYPVLIKASAGGGGKAMHIVAQESELAPALATARREAKAAFGDDRLLLERYLIDPRHIEVQVFADRHGNAVHLFERDCSVQRRHQKLIEESPAPEFGEDARARLGAIAVAAARAVDYRGAGTVEFVAANGDFHFIEMNTRLQVEHVVTEMTTGLDLVEWQLRIAAGEPLPLAQADIRRDGHAIEARLYAENPAHDFLPVAGPLALLRLPAESAALRIETGLRQGDRVTPYYDALIAKLVAWGKDRAAATGRLHAALAATKLAGIASNRDLLLRILAHPDFTTRRPDTGFIARHRTELLAPDETPFAALVAASLALLHERAAAAPADRHSPWQTRDGWRLLGEANARFLFRAGDRPHALQLVFAKDHYRCESADRGAAVRITRIVAGDVAFTIDGSAIEAAILRQEAELWVVLPEATCRLAIVDLLAPADAAAGSGGEIVAPMPGKVGAVLVAPGAKVKRGETLMLIEAMKMEHAILAPSDGIVAAIHFAAGALVEEGARLLALEADRA